MKNICLSIDQMQKLKELGISTKNASMCWINDNEGNATAELHDEFCYEMSFMNPVPAFTLQDMLEIMPEIYSAMVNCEREYSLNKKKWLVVIFSNPICVRRRMARSLYKFGLFRYSHYFY